MDYQEIKRILTTLKLASDDPHTQVSCYIKTLKYGSKYGTVYGVNRSTDGVVLSGEKLERPNKYIWIEHAERNAIYKAAKLGIKLDKATMFTTHFPCNECARAIVQSGINRLYYMDEKVNSDTEYHFKESFLILEYGGVFVEKLFE